MRQIKFRIWIPEAPHKTEEMFYQENQYLASFIRRVHMAYGVKDHPSYLPFEFEERLMQFTGMTDVEGQDIYEGDIFDCAYADETKDHHRWVMEWSDDYDKFLLRRSGKPCNQSGVTHSAHDMRRRKVLGNIYQNPELLKNDN